jgi:hypothetical protein
MFSKKEGNGPLRAREKGQVDGDIVTEGAYLCVHKEWLRSASKGHTVFSSAPRLPAWPFLRRINRGVLPPPHSLRQAQGCGFPH